MFSFHDFLLLKEDAGTAAKTLLYPSSYGGIGLFPAQWWLPRAADAIVYISQDERFFKNGDGPPFSIEHLPGHKQYGDKANNGDGPPFSIEHLPGHKQYGDKANNGDGPPFSIKHVPNFKEWVISEISQEYIKALNKWQKENPKLPFDNLFPNGATRIVIPFYKQDQIALSILDKLRQKFVKIDFDNSTLSDGKRIIKIGKYILGNKSPLTEPEKSWWIHRGSPVADLKAASQYDKYAIIISRNPVDVLRMSDHGTWSCHAPGASYFKCAVAESREGGLICFVVKRSELNKINLNSPEIFHDAERGVEGIKPIERIRLRRFENIKEKYNLAVPETRTYGQKIPGVEESLRSWAYDAQQDVLKGDRPRVKDFQLMGGSYQDTSGSELLNNFFGDRIDIGAVKYGGTQEEQSQSELWEKEIAEIENEYNFTICYYHVEIEDADNQPYVFFGGGVSLPLPKNFNDEKNPRDFESAAKDWARDNDIYSEEVSRYGDHISFDISSEEPPNPDGFRDFMDDLNEIDKKKLDLINSFHYFCMNAGYAPKNQIYQTANDSQNQFQHFAWNFDDSLSVNLKQNIPLFPPSLVSNNQAAAAIWWNIISEFKHKDFQVEDTMIMNDLNQLADRILLNQNRQKTLFGRDAYKRPFNKNFKIKPVVKLNLDKYNNNISFSIHIDFEMSTADHDFHEALEFVKFLDEHFDQFLAIVKKMFETIYYKQFNLEWAKYQQEFKNHLNLPL